MKLPAGLLGASIAQVFYREASDKYNKDKDIQEIVFRLMKKLFAVAMAPIALLYIFAEDLFRIVFGEEWSIAGTYAQAISPYILFHFIASPMGMIPLIVNKQEKAFLWGLTESVLFVSVFVFGYFFYHDLNITINLLSLVMALYFMVYFNWIYRISKGNK
jgi:O-antigen/teichoic acid export membrane protein